VTLPPAKSQLTDEQLRAVMDSTSWPTKPAPTRIVRSRSGSTAA